MKYDLTDKDYMLPEQQTPIDQPDQPQPQPQLQSDPQPQMQPQQPQPEAVQSQPQPEIEPQPQYVPQSVQAPQQPATDPGKLFNILGLVFAFIALQLPGLILSIIGLRKSKKAGYPITLAVVGICLNIFFMLATVGVLVAISTIAYNGVQERTFDTSRQANANSIIDKAEMYNMNLEGYPTIEQLRSITDNGALTDEESAALKDTDQPTGDEIGYQTCKDDIGTVIGANVYVYSNSEKHIAQAGIVGNCSLTTLE